MDESGVLPMQRIHDVPSAIGVTVLCCALAPSHPLRPITRSLGGRRTM
jgi:hypothetical protein